MDALLLFGDVSKHDSFRNARGDQVHPSCHYQPQADAAKRSPVNADAYSQFDKPTDYHLFLPLSNPPKEEGGRGVSQSMQQIPAHSARCHQQVHDSKFFRWNAKVSRVPSRRSEMRLRSSDWPASAFESQSAFRNESSFETPPLTRCAVTNDQRVAQPSADQDDELGKQRARIQNVIYEMDWCGVSRRLSKPTQGDEL